MPASSDRHTPGRGSRATPAAPPVAGVRRRFGPGRSGGFPRHRPPRADPRVLHEMPADQAVVVADPVRVAPGRGEQEPGVLHPAAGEHERAGPHSVGRAAEAPHDHFFDAITPGAGDQLGRRRADMDAEPRRGREHLAVVPPEADRPAEVDEDGLDPGRVERPLLQASSVPGQVGLADRGRDTAALERTIEVSVESPPGERPSPARDPVAVLERHRVELGADAAPRLGGSAQHADARLVERVVRETGRVAPGEVLDGWVEVDAPALEEQHLERRRLLESEGNRDPGRASADDAHVGGDRRPVSYCATVDDHGCSIRDR